MTPGSRRRAFVVVAVAIALALAASATPSPLYVEYEQRWHVSSALITAVYACYAGGVVVALLVVGGLSDRMGRRRTLMFSLALLAGSMAAFVAADNVVWLFAARLVQGVATGVFTAAAAAALTDLQAEDDGRRAGLVNSTAQSLGIAAGALAAGALAEWAPSPLRLAYVVIGAGCVVLLALVGMFVPETVALEPGLGVARLLRPQPLAVPRETRKAFAWAAAGVVAAWSVGGVYLALGGALAQGLLGIENHLVGALTILCVQGAGGLFSLAFTSVSNQRASLIAYGALILGLLFSALAIATAGDILFFGGAVITGLGFGLGFMSSTRRLTQAAPGDRRAEVMAAYFVTAYAAISVPALVAGVMSDRWGLAVAFYALAAVMGALSAALLVLSVRARPA